MSHTRCMEQKMETKTISTKENQGATFSNAVLISKSDAEEYRAYKKQKALSLITSSIQKSQGSLLSCADMQKVCERAVRFRQAAVQTPLSKISQAALYLGASGVKLDCVVGGTGETLAKVKAFEAREAVKMHAKEITLVITPSLIDACRYGEIKKEIKRVRRAARKADLKVRIEKLYPPTVLSRLARLCSEMGVKYFSVPYFSGCERLRLDVTRECSVEVFGVENLQDYRRLVGAGVRRIVTDSVAELYSAWLCESNETLFSMLKTGEVRVENGENINKNEENLQDNEKKEEKTPQNPPLSACPQAPINPETEYKCRLEGTQLKFL